jgi:hypothetical protein
MRRCGRWLVLVGALGAGAWLLPKFVPLPIAISEGYEPFGPPMSHRVSKVVKDDRPAFHIDPEQPWRIEFGRGSGWHGLDTAKLDQDGRLVLHRLRQDREGNVIALSWETTTAQLPPSAVAKVLAAVESNRLLELDKAYHANVADGTQWVLWVRQGDREKSVYFDNHFPERIVRFAEQLDQVVSGSVGPGLRWRAVPSVEDRDHERELWESLRR